MSMIILGIGLVLVIEGLVFALAPSHVENALRAMIEMPPETRRIVGLGALALGVVFVWIARAFLGA